MNRGDRSAQELNRFWDILIEGNPNATPSPELEPETAEAVRWLHARRPGRAPDAARERVWHLLDTMADGRAPSGRPPGHAEPRSAPTGSHVAANGHLPYSVSVAHLHQPPRGIARASGRALTTLATAALLLLTLAVGYVAFWQRFQPPSTSSPHRPSLIRALDSASGGVTDELLFQTTFTPDQLPAGGREAIFYRVILPPGVSLPSLAGPFCLLRETMHTAGVGAELVQTGTYTLQLDAPIQVQRAAGTPAQEVPAETQVVLGPGDSVTYPDYSTRGTIANTGEEPVVLIGVSIVDTDGSGIPTPKLPDGVRTEYLSGTVPSDWRSVPDGPLAVSLWRLNLPANTTVGPYEAAGLESMRIESGMIMRSFMRPGESGSPSRPFFTLAGSTSMISPLAPGARRVIESADDPVELIALSIEPASIWWRTLVP